MSRAGRSKVSTNLAGDLSKSGETFLIEEQAVGQFLTNRVCKGLESNEETATCLSDDAGWLCLGRMGNVFR